MLQHQILAIVDLGEDVFKEVVAPSCIFVLRNGQPPDDHQVRLLDVCRSSVEGKASALGNLVGGVGNTCPQSLFLKNADLEFMIPPRKHAVSVVLLGECTELACRDAGINYQRVKVGMQEKGKSDLADRLLYAGKQQRPDDKMYWKGSDIDRYWIAEETSRFCRIDYERFIRSNEVVHLSEDVYQIAPKMLIRQTADHIIAAIDYHGVWFGRSIIAIVPKGRSQHRLEYFLALFNSRYFKWYYSWLVQEEGRVFAQVKLSKIKQMPIRRIDFSNPVDKAHHDRLVVLVDEMLDLHRRHAAAVQALDDARCDLARRIAAVDAAIDRLVYELYDLTEEEIAIVEGRSQPSS